MLTIIPEGETKYDLIHDAHRSRHTLAIRRIGRGPGPADWTIVGTMRLHRNRATWGAKVVLAGGDRVELARTCRWAVWDGEPDDLAAACVAARSTPPVVPMAAGEPANKPAAVSSKVLNRCPSCRRELEACPHCAHEEWCLYCLWCIRCHRGKIGRDQDPIGQNHSRSHLLQDIESRARKLYSDVWSRANDAGRAPPGAYLGALLHVKEDPAGRRLYLVVQYQTTAGTPRRIEEEL